MQRTKLISVLIASLLLFGAAFPYIPIAHAVNPTFRQSYTSPANCTNTLSCSTSQSASNVVAGDLIIVSFWIEASSAEGDCGVSITSITDTAGASFALDLATSCVQITTWYELLTYSGVATSTGKDTVTIHNTLGAKCDGIQANCIIPAYVVSDFANPSFSTVFATGSINPASNSNNPQQLGAGVSFTQSTALLFGVVFNTVSTSSVGTGFTTAGATATVFTEYSLPGGTVGSPSTFPFTVVGGPQVWADVGLVFDNNPTVFVVNGCNFFQLQCWWYPLLFMLMYAGVLMLVATQLKTSPRGKAHIFLSAVTFGSLIAVILGIMNIVFPLIMLVINTIIALRLRG